MIFYCYTVVHYMFHLALCILVPVCCILLTGSSLNKFSADWFNGLQYMPPTYWFGLLQYFVLIYSIYIIYIFSVRFSTSWAAHAPPSFVFESISTTVLPIGFLYIKPVLLRLSLTLLRKKGCKVCSIP